MRKYMLGVIFFSVLVIPLTTFASIDINLRYGSKGIEVAKLQNFLASKGYLNAEATGNFFSLTQLAVIVYQKANNIFPAAGFVGPATRSAINKELMVSQSARIPTVTTPNKEQSIEVSKPQVIYQNIPTQTGNQNINIQTPIITPQQPIQIPAVDTEWRRRVSLNNRDVNSGTISFVIFAENNGVRFDKSLIFSASSPDYSNEELQSIKYDISASGSMSGDDSNYYIVPAGSNRNFYGSFSNLPKHGGVIDITVSNLGLSWLYNSQEIGGSPLINNLPMKGKIYLGQDGVIRDCEAWSGSTGECKSLKISTQ